MCVCVCCVCVQTGGGGRLVCAGQTGVCISVCVYRLVCVSVLHRNSKGVTSLNCDGTEHRAGTGAD